MFALVTLGVVLSAGSAAAQRDSVVDQADSLGVLKRLSVEQLMDIEVTSVSRRPERLGQTASAIQVITQDDIHRAGASSLPEALRLAANLQVAQVDSRQWAIGARGFNSTTANKLLVLIDGRTVYTPLFSGVFWDAQDLSLADIERIEVISGPGATLWGANAVNGVINIVTRGARDTQGLLLSGGGGTELRTAGSARYGGMLGSTVSYRVYGKGFGREASALSDTLGAGDDWHMGQGGVRVDWEATHRHRITLQGDLYNGRIGQLGGGDIAVSGGNVLGKWTYTVSGNSAVTAQLYYDRTHRNIPQAFGENLETYDLEVQHRTQLGAHDVVWGLGYRLINDHVLNSTALAFLPPHVARQWFTGFIQDEIALVPDRLHAALGTKLEHNDYTGVEIQPSARVNWTLSPTTTFWAAVSRAVRTPSRIDREFFVPGQPPYALAGGATFHSEEELAYEVGYRRQQGMLALSVAAFYSRYRGLRSLEQVNPPAAVPLVIGNGQDGESYGGEWTADYRVTARWRLSAGYTELRVHIWPTAGSTDTSRGAAEANAPNRQVFLRSSLDLPGHFGVDGWFRYIADIANQHVPAYAELNARLAWQPTASLDLALVGQNLLHNRHAEFGTPTARRQLKRGVYGVVEWRF